MSHIIAACVNNSITLASDTRMNYHEVVEEDGGKYQFIKFTADCIRKTFYLEKGRLGIQFVGIGFLEYNKSNCSLSYLIPQFEIGLKSGQKIKLKMKIVLNNIKKFTKVGDLGSHVKGIITGFCDSKMYIGTFNTFIDYNLDIKEFICGNFVDSENYIKSLDGNGYNEDLAIKQIINTINSRSRLKPQLIGGEVEVLKITQNKAVYINKAKKLFTGLIKELSDFLNKNSNDVNLVIFNPPVKEEISLQ